MQPYATLALLIAASACQRTDDFVGDDLGDNETPDLAAADPGNYEFDSATAVLDVVGTCGPAQTVPAEALAAVGGSRLIDVVHTGVVESSCAVWDLSATVDTADNGIRMVYTDTSAGTCAEPDCEWEFSYTVDQVEPGFWVVFAGTEKALATVVE